MPWWRHKIYEFWRHFCIMMQLLSGYVWDKKPVFYHSKLYWNSYFYNNRFVFFIKDKPIGVIECIGRKKRKFWTCLGFVTNPLHPFLYYHLLYVKTRRYKQSCDKKKYTYSVIQTTDIQWLSYILRKSKRNSFETNTRILIPWMCYIPVNMGT